MLENQSVATSILEPKLKTMNTEEQTRSAQSNAFARQPPGLLGKILAFVVGAGFLVLAFMFSLVALAVIVVVGLGVWGWLWWKTRAIRKQMREQMNEQSTTAAPARDGFVIEGEVIREESSPSRPERLLR
jgi:uncharacterized protein HemX